MIKVKLKLCKGCNEPKHIWKNVNGEKYCKSCYGKLGTGVAKKPKPTAARIPVYSSKRAKQNAVYSVMRIKFLQDHPMCEMHLSGICTQKATEVHHTAGRIEELLLDTRFWKSGCHNCHSWVELHPVEAKELGLSVDRLSIQTNEQKDQP